jgi:Protein of unknown function (DUF541)
MPAKLQSPMRGRKAEVYAQALGIQLGRVEWISEVSGFVPPAPMRSPEASAMTAASVLITGGEDTLRVRITIGFDIAVDCGVAQTQPYDAASLSLPQEVRSLEGGWDILFSAQWPPD